MMRPGSYRGGCVDVNCVPSREKHEDALRQPGLWSGVGRRMLEWGLEVIWELGAGPGARWKGVMLVLDMVQYRGALKEQNREKKSPVLPSQNQAAHIESRRPATKQGTRATSKC